MLFWPTPKFQSHNESCWQNLNNAPQIFIHHSDNYPRLFNSKLFEQSGWNVWGRIWRILPQFTSDLIQSVLPPPPCPARSPDIIIRLNLTWSDYTNTTTTHHPTHYRSRCKIFRRRFLAWVEKDTTTYLYLVQRQFTEPEHLCWWFENDIFDE